MNRDEVMHRKVGPSFRVPSNWDSFLWVDENKTELFSLPSNQVVLIEGDRPVYITVGENILVSIPNEDCSALVPCCDEEANTCMFVHINDAVTKGYHKIMIRTVDTDGLVLAISWSCSTRLAGAVSGIR